MFFFSEDNKYEKAVDNMQRQDTLVEQHRRCLKKNKIILTIKIIEILLVFSSESRNEILMKIEEIHSRTRAKYHSKNSDMVKPDGSFLRVSQDHFILEI